MRQQTGFTLLELLIAVTLMAVLAVMSWRGLETVLLSRDRLNRSGDELQALTITFAQIDEDLRRSWPARLLEPGAPSIRFTDDEGVLTSVQVLREGGGALDPVRVERVAYRLNNGVFERGYAEYLKGAAPDTAAYQWQPLLVGVTAVRYRAWLEGSGWVGTLATGAGANKPVLGVELALERGPGRLYTRIFSVRD
jgi:general secretion pathway protein J